MQNSSTLSFHQGVPLQHIGRKGLKPKMGLDKDKFRT